MYSKFFLLLLGVFFIFNGYCQISGTHLWKLSKQSNPYQIDEGQNMYGTYDNRGSFTSSVVEKNNQSVQSLIQPGYITNITSSLNLPSARLYASSNARIKIGGNNFVNLNSEMIINPNMQKEPSSSQLIAALLPRASNLGFKIGMDLPLFGFPEGMVSANTSKNYNEGISLSLFFDAFILQKNTSWYDNNDVLQNDAYGAWHLNPGLRVILAQSFLAIDLGYNWLNPRYNRDALVLGVPYFLGVNNFQYINVSAVSALKLNDNETSFVNVYMNFILNEMDVTKMDAHYSKLAVTPMLTISYGALAELN
ncbi:MAG: hypothetical protein KDC92_06225 [Bacteroidetes bacterium]|nr:hypothetical protein [Bacteroidota bacterium]